MKRRCSSQSDEDIIPSHKKDVEATYRCFEEQGIPPEIDAILFSFLGRFMLRVVCPLVNKSWNRMANDYEVLVDRSDF